MGVDLSAPLTGMDLFPTTPFSANFRITDLYGQSDARFTSNPCSVNDLGARAQIGPYKSF